MDADVIVIGAGAAGLAAALELAKRSVRVVLLEGRDRTAGRVMWQHVGSIAEPAELGAEFIHGDAPETSALMRAAGLRSIETGDASWTIGPDGKLEPTPDDDGDDIFERARSHGEDESVAAFLDRLEAADPALRDAARRARAFVEGFEAADPALASTRAIADELASGVDSWSSRPLGSYAPLFASLEAQCARAAVDLRLRATVERIAWEPGSVTIQGTAGDGAAFGMRARCAIVTVPVGVLRQREPAARLTFDPPLPAAKRAALDGLEMGHVVRVNLAFRTPFWETLEGGRYRDAAFFRSERGAFNAFWTQMPVRSRMIAAWAGGPRAAALRGTPVQERIDRARDEFGALFGHIPSARAELEAGATHDWTTDPFACGAYSYVVTGAGAARAALGTPVAGTLFFAGEATSTNGQGGTVSGAFATGMRAANEAAGVLERARASAPAAP